ncbi:hypothetical protein RYX36_031308, partial [Vicia faba]
MASHDRETFRLHRPSPKNPFLGRNNLHPFRPPRPDNIVTICYTSSTTGTLK